MTAHATPRHAIAAYSARAHLIVFGLLIALPLLAAAGLMIYRSVALERVQLEQRMTQVVDDLVDDLDRDLARHLTVLRTLAALPAVRDPDLSAFHAQARAVVDEIGLGILLTDPGSMKVVLTTLRPNGEALPVTGNPEGVKRILAGATHDISDAFIGTVSKLRVFHISVPVARDGKVLYVLALALGPDRLLPLLQGQKLGPGWVTAVWDGRGMLMARSPDRQALVGTSSPEPLRALPDGRVRPMRDTDGARVLGTVAKSSLSDWHVTVNAPVSEVEGQLRTTLLLLAGSAIGGLALAIGLGVVFGRRLSSPLSLSSAAALALGRGEAIAPDHSTLLEANTINRALQTAQQELDERQQELRHLAEQLSAAADAAEFGSYDFDVAKGTVEWSPHLKKLLGAEDITGPVAGDVAVSFIHPEDRAQAQALIQRVLDGAQEKYELEFRVIRRDNRQTRWVMDRGAVTKDSEGKVRRVVGVLIDVSGKKAAEDRQRLLLQELNHRVKNTLAVVQSIATQTIRTQRDPARFVEAFSARIISLARSHDLLTRNVWQGAQLRDVVDAALTSFRNVEGAIEVSGPDVLLTADNTVAMSLLLHELATNAAKYGALSVAGGRLRISWSVSKAPSTCTIDFNWAESGGPPVETPAAQGFGTRLINGIASQLDGTVEIDFSMDGVRCHLRFPVPAQGTDPQQRDGIGLPGGRTDRQAELSHLR
ncbi:MAG: PAS domain-containing protein [Xanthobacteraceae bacterium]|nr:PAS domain-containing protein [Xanthobacteraceae bacterium]